SGRPSTSRAIDCPRSPLATEPIARVTSVVGQTRSSISVLMAATSSAHPPTAPGTLIRCLSLPSLPTARETRADSAARRSLTVAMSLKASAIFPLSPVRSEGSRTANLPSCSASRASSRSLANESTPLTGGVATRSSAVPTASRGPVTSICCLDGELNLNETELGAQLGSQGTYLQAATLEVQFCGLLGQCDGKKCVVSCSR